MTTTLIKLPLGKKYKKGNLEIVRIVKVFAIYDIFYSNRHIGQFKGDGFYNYKGRRNEFYKHYEGSTKSSNNIIIFKRIGGKTFLKTIFFPSIFQDLFTFKREILIEKIKTFD